MSHRTPIIRAVVGALVAATLNAAESLEEDAAREAWPSASVSSESVETEIWVCGDRHIFEKRDEGICGGFCRLRLALFVAAKDRGFGWAKFVDHCWSLAGTGEPADFGFEGRQRVWRWALDRYRFVIEPVGTNDLWGVGIYHDFSEVEAGKPTRPKGVFRCKRDLYAEGDPHLKDAIERAAGTPGGDPSAPSLPSPLPLPRDRRANCSVL